MRKCFTINQMRKKEEINSFSSLIADGLYQGIEIFYPYKESDEQYMEYTTSVKKLITNNKGVEVVLHLPFGKGMSLCLEEERDEALNTILEASDYGALFNASKLTLHLGAVKDCNDRTTYYEDLKNRVKRICEHAAGHRQVVMIENMPTMYEYGYNPLEIRNIIDDIQMPNLFFIYDTGHAHVSCYDDLLYLDVLGDKLYHMHMHDNLGDRDAHKPFGEGNIDFDKLFKKLNEVHYKELHCMEIIYKDSNDLKAFSQTVDKYEDYYE